MSNDVASSEWGRIDSDGTVWVKTESGERPIASWQAGDPAAGLAHYERRFEDLATEVELLERRLASGAGDPASTLSHAATLRESLGTAAVVGDLDGLDRRLVKLAEAAQAKADEMAELRTRSRQEAVAAKERLVAEAEGLAESTQWKATGDRFRAIVEEWKAVRGADRRTDAALWKRFAAARDTFTRRRGSHFAELDKQRHAAKLRKEQLVAEAEALAGSADWGPTASRLKTLMSEWKAAGRATKDAEEQLWQRFRSAQDTFFTRRSEAYGERSAEQHDNQRRKEQVVAEAEALDLSDLRAAQARLRELQEGYDRAGHVPREVMRGLDGRMRAAEQRVREALDAQWRRTTANSNPVLVQLRDAVAKAETQLAKAKASGDDKRIGEAEANLAARREWLVKALQLVSLDRPQPAVGLLIEAFAGQSDRLVSIYIDTNDEGCVTSVVEALRGLFATARFELSLSDGPEFSSWFARFKIHARDLLTNDEMVQRMQKLEHAIEVRVLQEPMSVVNVNQADAASRLIHSLSEIDNAVLLIGSLIVVKATDHYGVAQVFAKTLSLEEIRNFEVSPHLMKNPHAALEYLRLHPPEECSG